MINSNDYGNYTIGENKIVLSENLLGGGREASAKLATVMSHEGIIEKNITNSFDAYSAFEAGKELNPVASDKRGYKR